MTYTKGFELLPSQSSRGRRSQGRPTRVAIYHDVKSLEKYTSPDQLPERARDLSSRTRERMTSAQAHYAALCELLRQQRLADDASMTGIIPKSFFEAHDRDSVNDVLKLSGLTTRPSLSNAEAYDICIYAAAPVPWGVSGGTVQHWLTQESGVALTITQSLDLTRELLSQARHTYHVVEQRPFAEQDCTLAWWNFVRRPEKRPSHLSYRYTLLHDGEPFDRSGHSASQRPASRLPEVRDIYSNAGFQWVRQSRKNVIHLNGDGDHQAAATLEIFDHEFVKLSFLSDKETYTNARFVRTRLSKTTERLEFFSALVADAYGLTR